GPAPGNPPPAQPGVPAATAAASPAPIAYAKPAVDALARRWLDDAIAGRIDVTKLRPSARAALRLPRIQAALRDLARFGDRTYTLVNVDRRAPTSAYQYILRTPKRTLLYIFAIDDDGLIAGGDVFDPNPLASDPAPAPGAAAAK
ncbi:MAG TPA: hypothetical protein VN224_02545, partial [Xanthomonadales bacterium]|nr:hypothetical protein [Xanthomonadales bacterium]